MLEWYPSYISISACGTMKAFISLDQSCYKVDSLIYYKVVMNMRIGLQLYTVRDATETDFIGTLERVAEMGYEGVEFAGYGGLTPEEMKSALDRLGLKAAGSHVGLDQLVNNLDMHIEMNKAVGNHLINCPWIPANRYESREALAETARLLEEASQQLAAHGMKLGYHNHDFEFTNKIDGLTVQEQLFAALTPEQLQCELDACWVQYSGNDPIEWIGKFAGRLPIVHLKDLARTEDGKPLTVELGKGELDLRGVAAAAKAAGTEWLIVEQDVTQRDSIVSVEASMQWVKAHIQDLLSD